jgi:hypothetical protein
MARQSVRQGRHPTHSTGEGVTASVTAALNRTNPVERGSTTRVGSTNHADHHFTSASQTPLSDSGSERLHRAKIGKWLVVGAKRLNTDVRGPGCEMRLDAIANPILGAPCDNRVD